ncbi:Sybindin-like protein [Biscogniauxia sp. FL1348]|nr:Sybindin-like protein [Biscogniauxia sp. FL1348]
MPIQVYSLYIFDRHTQCVYSKLWHAVATHQQQQHYPAPPSSSHNAHPPPPSSSSSSSQQHQHQLSTTQQQQQQQLPAQSHQATSSLTNGSNAAATAAAAAVAAANARAGNYHMTSARASDDAKLIFGAVFSLRNMVRKLGGDDDAFISYRTSQYKLHYYETPTNLRFAMLTEPGALSMRNVLHQIYINLWVEYVVKNPLAPTEHKGGEGVRNEMFEMGLDKFIRGLM